MTKQDRGPPTPIRDNPAANPRGMYGFYSDRLVGLHDLLRYAEGASVLDIAMNHGLVGFEFARHGAALVHGCDRHEPAVNAARAIFSELAIPSRFEVVDLARGAAALETAFGQHYLPGYDIVLFLGIYHKLKTQTSDAVITELVRHLVNRVARYFVVRTGQAMLLEEVGLLLGDTGLRRVHFSALSSVVGAVEIWQRS
jgi:SAM-dependent methyltransferase